MTVTGVDDAWTTATRLHDRRPRPPAADANYNGVNAADVAVTNTDNDAAGITVTPTTGLTTTEARRDGDLHGRADSQPTADVTIGLSSSDTTEGTVAGEPDLHDGQLERGADRDGHRRRRRAGRRRHRLHDRRPRRRPAATRPTTGSTPPTSRVTNTDNDAAGITVTPTTGLTTTEARRHGDLHGRADSAADRRRDDRPELERHRPKARSPASLTFTAANWNVAQTVTVTGVDDALDDGDIAYTIVTAAATSARRDLQRRQRRRRRGHQHRQRRGRHHRHADAGPDDDRSAAARRPSPSC